MNLIWYSPPTFDGSLMSNKQIECFIELYIQARCFNDFYKRSWVLFSVHGLITLMEVKKFLTVALGPHINHAT